MGECQVILLAVFGFAILGGMELYRRYRRQRAKREFEKWQKERYGKRS